MSKGLPQVGDILFTTEAPLGNVAQVDNSDIALAQRVIKFRGNKELLNDYLLHFMIGPVYQKLINRKANGTTVLGISGKELHKTKIQFPSLPEQQKIASFLSAIDDKVQQLTKKKVLLEDYKKGVMQQLFSGQLRFKAEDGKDYPDWEEKRLSKFLKYYDGTHQTPKYVEKGVPFYSVEHITRNQFSKTKFITEEVFEKENKRVMLEKGDILMTRIGDIGTARLIDWDVRASFYVSLALLKQNPSFDSTYLNQYISSVPFQKELWAKTIHVAFPKKINLGEIGNCKAQLPCIEEQQKIATYLSGIDTKIESVNTQITQTQSFKKGLLQQMFV
jgi:type I restriction enzyme S subunit